MSNWYDKFTEAELIEARHELRTEINTYRSEFWAEHEESIDFLIDTVLVTYIKSVHAYNASKGKQASRYANAMHAWNRKNK